MLQGYTVALNETLNLKKIWWHHLVNNSSDRINNLIYVYVNACVYNNFMTSILSLQSDEGCLWWKLLEEHRSNKNWFKLHLEKTAMADLVQLIKSYNQIDNSLNNI